MSQHHASCQPSDRDLVWMCAQCGGHESAENILDLLAEIRELMPDATMKDLKDRITAIEQFCGIAK